jgi:hypothetical protein
MGDEPDAVIAIAGASGGDLLFLLARLSALFDGYSRCRAGSSSTPIQRLHHFVLVRAADAEF